MWLSGRISKMLEWYREFCREECRCENGFKLLVDFLTVTKISSDRPYKILWQEILNAIKGHRTESHMKNELLYVRIFMLFGIGLISWQKRIKGAMKSINNVVAYFECNVYIYLEEWEESHSSVSTTRLISQSCTFKNNFEIPTWLLICNAHCGVWRANDGSPAERAISHGPIEGEWLLP